MTTETFSMTQNIMTITVSIISGIGSGLVTVFLSHKFEKNKTWWGEKKDEYKRIIRVLAEELNRAFKFMDHNFARKENIEKGKLSEDKLKEAVEGWNSGIENIRITAMAGSLFISEEAVKELQDLLRKLDKIDDSDDDVVIKNIDEYKVLGKTIDAINEHGKKDLKNEIGIGTWRTWKKYWPTLDWL